MARKRTRAIFLCARIASVRYTADRRTVRFVALEGMANRLILQSALSLC
jgi:hypothetical protein